MKIAFDVRWIRGRQLDGISRYTVNLLSQLLRLDSDNQYLLLGDAAILQTHLEPAILSRADYVPLSQPLLSPQDFLLTQREVQRFNVDIFHVPHYLTTPFGGSYKKIVTVYDLIPFLFPQALSKSRALWRWFYRSAYPAKYILRSADAILTISDHSKHDLMRLLGVPAEKIRVVCGGIESHFAPVVKLNNEVFHKLKLPRQFILYVGRQDPYKGLSYLVRAYALLPGTLRAAYPLVLAGKMDCRYIGEVQALIAQYQLESTVQFLDYVDDADLPALYSAATLLAHPSLYEGLGLTPLEAMACGTPVVYADTSSLPEMLGTAGLAVTPASAGALADGMRTLLENESQRQMYAERGRQQARQYTWERVARNVLEVYREVVD